MVEGNHDHTHGYEVRIENGRAKGTGSSTPTTTPTSTTSNQAGPHRHGRVDRYRETTGCGGGANRTPRHIDHRLGWPPPLALSLWVFAPMRRVFGVLSCGSQSFSLRR
jgi:hypothetical protein